MPFEKSGVGESQGNAVVERAIWDIESMTRTLVHAAQEFHDAKIEKSTHPVRVFAVEYSAQPINRAQRGEGQQDSVRATQVPTIQEKTSAVCASSDVSPCGREKRETKV